MLVAAVSTVMAEHVLVAHDGSPQSEAALEHALAEHGDTRITVLRVIDPVAAGYSAEATIAGAEQWFGDAKTAAEEALATVRQRGAERGVEVDTAVEVGRPTSTIVEYVAANDVDHLVLGSHGRTGVSRILLGSVAEGVMRNSPVPVTVVR